jgi:hypothetical protein
MFMGRCFYGLVRISALKSSRAFLMRGSFLKFSISEAVMAGDDSTGFEEFVVAAS